MNELESAIIKDLIQYVRRSGFDAYLSEDGSFFGGEKLVVHFMGDNMEHSIDFAIRGSYITRPYMGYVCTARIDLANPDYRKELVSLITRCSSMSCYSCEYFNLT